ncbi:FeoA family protein [Motilimonas pumila]|uniref:Ferrous iron transport protein A n=1 Tax=Motilimonas pumila TaxID=2303987 RepID=A0A418YEX0_9GAMM|nr:FeoA family protein [Motilimonas pumila]RJG47729.1 ferrous iron transport protein A [Motilimonas pumila]
MKLSELKPGQRASIVSFDGIDTGSRKKLLAMGLIPKASIEMLRHAPMGGPLQIRTKSISLALRQEFAQQIAVALIEPTQQGVNA